jgi:hypothetical protein
MAPTPTGVLKKNQVRSSGPRRLGAACDPAESRRPAAGGPAGVRIARRDADRAVIEVRCACGNVTLIECRWPGEAAAPDDPSTQAPEGPDPSEKEDA